MNGGIPTPLVTDKSPLAEGRELKCFVRLNADDSRASPLAEGRELKSHKPAPMRVMALPSPLAEGRELK